MTVEVDKVGVGKLVEVAGIEHAINSNEAFHLDHLPKSIVVAGGGYIALEFACIFNGLGVETTVIHRGPNVLRGFDDDIRSHVAEELEASGIKVRLGTRIASIEKTAGGLVSACVDGDTVTVWLITLIVNP